MANFPYIFSALSIMFGIYEFARGFAVRSRTRSSELAIAQKMLEAHYSALEQLGADPATSDSMLRLAVFVSDSIADRKLSLEICRLLMEEDKAPKPSGSILLELEALRRTRPDLTEAFEKAITCGVLALIYRWPETACKAEAVASSLVAEKKREMMTVYRFAQSRHDGVLVAA